MITQQLLMDIRKQFPALIQADDAGNVPIYFDGPGGSQIPHCVMQAMVAYLCLGNSNMGGYNQASVRTMAVNDLARQQARVWLGGGTKAQIVFGQNATSLMFMISRVIARTWQAGDNIVLSSLDHYSHVSSWQQAADDAGVEVRMIPLNDTLDDLDYQAAAELVDGRTRLVAITAASNLIGTITDIARISQMAKAVGALLSIDAVHAAVHIASEFKAWGADLLFASAYKIGGPHLGMMCAKHALLTQLRPYKVEPATNVVPMSYEQGTQSFESQAGFVAMMRYWSALGLDDGLPSFDEVGTQSQYDLTATSRQKTYHKVMAYEQTQSQYLLEKFKQRPFLQLYGKQSASNRTPTFAFNVIKAGVIQDGAKLSQWLAGYNIALGFGNFYAKNLSERLADTGTVLRLGCLHYTTFAEIDRLFELIDQAVCELYQITLP